MKQTRLLTRRKFSRKFLASYFLLLGYRDAFNSISSNRRSLRAAGSTKRGKERGRLVHRDKESLVYNKRLSTAHTFSPSLSFSFRQTALVCYTARASECLIVWFASFVAGTTASRERQEIACGYARAHTTWFTGDTRIREREETQKEKGRGRICRSERIRGYGSSNKVITRKQTAGTMLSRGERSSTSRNIFAGKYAESCAHIHTCIYMRSVERWTCIALC